MVSRFLFLFGALICSFTTSFQKSSSETPDTCITTLDGAHFCPLLLLVDITCFLFLGSISYIQAKLSHSMVSSISTPGIELKLLDGGKGGGLVEGIVHLFKKVH